MGITLSDRDVEELVRVQRLLLDPLQFPDLPSWGQACSEAFRQLVGGDVAGMNVPIDEGLRDYNTDSAMDRAMAEYSEYFWQVDEGLHERRRRIGSPDVFHEEDVWTRQELLHDELFVDWRKPNKLFEPLMVGIDVGQQIPAMIIAFREKDDQRNLMSSRKELARLLVPCFESSVRFWYRGHRFRGELDGMIEQLGCGVHVYDEDGSLSHQNAIAVALTAEGPVGESVLKAAERLAGLMLRRTGPVSRASDAVAGVRLQALRLGPGIATHRPMALVTLEDRRGRLPSEREVQQRHGLTPRQAEVALLMARRLTHKEIAKRLDIRPNTARRHCQAVLRRLGLHRKKDVRAQLTEAGVRQPLER